MNSSMSGSSVMGFFQARILELVAISFSRGSSWPKSQTTYPALQADFLPLSYKGSPNTYIPTLSLPEFFEVTGCDMISSMHDFMHFFFLFGWIYLHVEPPSGFIFCLTCQHLHRLSDLPHPSPRKPPLNTITFSPDPLNSTFSLYA